jgi:uncharacterized protein YdeI (YjbR/CyaY-like superfamily)
LDINEIEPAECRFWQGAEMTKAIGSGTIPADLAQALAKADGARARFDAMPASHQKEWLRVIEEAKKPQTRQRRIENAVKAVKAMPPR